MLTRDAQANRRLRTKSVHADLAVVGGGMAGVCCAITAARAGTKVVLVQDRPVLGGNASSEVRLWILGATSHMGNNNRWSREGGVIDEILVENIYRNPEGNPVLFDSLLLEKVISEKNITLLLNTAVHDVTMQGDRICSVRAFCSQNSTQYEVCAPLYCDASGDGIVGFLAGAAFRIGAESQMEFGELLAPAEEHSDLLGHSLYFYTRDTGRSVHFTPPSYCLDDIQKIPRYRHFNTTEHGCQLWWVEYGGSRDTVHDTEEIKWELWKIVYGVWNHIKNSGEFPDADTITLEWVGLIPGKRESRRFEGDYMLAQQDIVEQRTHYDAISYGGWAIDLHPVDAIYSAEAPCTQWHSKGVYQIPYRTMYSRNVSNLFLAGRIISASHIAFGSTRVMATCAHNAQAVGMAAALCRQENVMPRELARPNCIRKLQQRLLAIGHYIPGVVACDERDLAQKARISATSHLHLKEIVGGQHLIPLSESRAVLVPVEKGRLPEFTFFAEASDETDLVVQLRTCSRAGSFTPDVIQEVRTISLQKRVEDSIASANAERNGDESLNGSLAREGSTGIATATAWQTTLHRSLISSLQPVKVQFQTEIAEACYAFICLMANYRVMLLTSEQLVSGFTTLVHRENSRVAKSMVQGPPVGIGIDRFEFWTPERRPKARNVAIRITPPLKGSEPTNVTNGVARPACKSNAWVADINDPQPAIELRWTVPQVIGRIELTFDTDFDHALENVLMLHSERVMPACVRGYRVRGFGGELLAERSDNHQTRNVVDLVPPVTTDVLTIELDAPSKHVPASLLEVRCY